MIPVYTQKSLDKLTWNQIQKLHSSLNLKATATTRTRRDYQNRIVAVQPQPVVAPEAIATPLTCATCPLARHIEDERYECGACIVTSIIRGHWEATGDCYQAVADTHSEVTATQPEVAATVEMPIIPEEIIPITQSKISLAERRTGLSHHPFAYNWEEMQGGHCFSSFFYDLCECDRCNKNRELPLSEQRRGSHQVMLERLSQVKAKTPVTPVIQQSQNQMDELKQFTIDTSILSLIDSKQVEANSDPEGTICWHSPFAGTIAGKKGAVRDFYIRRRNCIVELSLGDPASYEIMIVLSANFTASETKHPNVRHAQIRDAINTGRAFAPKAFRDSPHFLANTKDYGGIGRIMQGADGRWWAWAERSVTGHAHPCREDACKYLEYVAAQAQKQLVCAN